MRFVRTLFVLGTAILLAGVAVHTAVLTAEGGRPYPAPPKTTGLVIAEGGRPYPGPPAAYSGVISNVGTLDRSLPAA